jgi:hypothetical protein
MTLVANAADIFTRVRTGNAQVLYHLPYSETVHLFGQRSDVHEVKFETTTKVR